MKGQVTVWKTGSGPQLAAFLLGLSLFAASAQSLSNDWFKIAGGGGASSNGLLAISGTIGQHDATTFTDGSLLVVGGYWVAAEAYQPVAASLVYGRSRGLSLKIKRAELVNNSFDPGVRALALAGINLTTTNRVTLSTNTVPATGLWSVIDPQATNPSRFYRVAY